MSGPLVRPAGTADIEPVAQFLNTHMNARIPAERWRRLMDYPWRPAEVERGWVVEDGGRIVGFMGTIYSDRPLAGGRTHRFCDLSSWYLLRDYRGDGTGDALLQAGMAKENVTYATMTARRATGRRIKALGFSILDDTRSVFRPRAVPDRLPLVTDPKAIREQLSEAERPMFDAHAGLDIHHAIVGEPGVWLAWQRKLKGASVAFHEILHAGDWRFVSAHAQAVADTIVTGDGAILAIDSRWMSPGDEQGEVEPLPLARWYRSDEVGPRDVDHLFGEIVLLDQKLP